VIAGSLDGIRVVDVYVVNGRAVGTPEYELKLRWLDALVAWLRTEHDPRQPVLVVGDFNVAPEDRDVHDPERWRGQNLCSEPERQRIETLLDWGFVDLMRLHEKGPGPFTWWDYREGAFHRGWGLRLDLALGTPALAERCTGVTVDRDERKPTFGEGKPSDHAPVVVTLA
jgi:exodeoxyribonuclease-3